MLARQQSADKVDLLAPEGGGSSDCSLRPPLGYGPADSSVSTARHRTAMHPVVRFCQSLRGCCAVLAVYVREVITHQSYG